jgi:hypothetical protein
MRETIDCGVLVMPGQESWMRSFIDTHTGQLGGITLHVVDLGESRYGGLGRASASSLRDAALALRRFDACLLPVTPLTLGWTRLALANALGSLHTPILGLARELQAPGLQDLLGLGMRDFLRDPATGDDLKVRIRQCTWTRGTAQGAALSDAGGVPMESELTPTRTRLIADEPFRAAKARIVTDFERRYLKQMLKHHQGNISKAARAADKNRRAFWQLMRKHEIAAEPFRASS